MNFEKTRVRCEECGQFMVFHVEDEDEFGIYGTIICPKCGSEEVYCMEKRHE